MITFIIKHIMLRAVMSINALIVNPLITELIDSLTCYPVKLSVNVSALTLTKLKY